MKKKLTLFLAAAITPSLIACNKMGGSLENESGSLSGDTSSTEQSTSKENPETDIQLEKTVLKELKETAGIYFEGSVCGMEKRLYYIEKERMGTHWGYAYHIDYATKQEVFLCSNSFCKTTVMSIKYSIKGGERYASGA